MADGQGRTLTGVIPYGKPSQLLGGRFYEVLQEGCFSGALKRDADVSMLYAHDDSQILGRTTSGTLSLASDSAGLRYTVKLPDTSLGRDVRELVSRGDLSNVSFGFSVNPKGEVRSKAADGYDLRTLTSVTLAEISLVTWPAYQSTTAAIRSMPPEWTDADVLSESDRHKLQLQIALRLRK